MILEPIKIAVIVTVFVVIFLALVAVIGFFSHIPLIGKALALFAVLILMAFVALFFVMAGKRK